MLPTVPPPLFSCLQLMPLLKLRHTNISIYREMFITWNGQVGHSRRPGQRSEHGALRATVPAGVSMAATCGNPDSAVTGAAAAWVEEGYHPGSQKKGRLRETGSSRALTSCVARLGREARCACPVHMPAAADLVPQAQ